MQGPRTGHPGHPGFWDDRYSRDDTPWDLGGPAPPLVRYLDQHPLAAGRTAVLGAGAGHDAIALARRGHAVTAFDFSAEALARLGRNVAAAGVSVEGRLEDILDLPPIHDGAFSLVVEHTCFCAIDPGRRRDYVRSIARLLPAGGHLLGLFYAHGREGGPPFRTSRAEVEELFGRNFTPRHIETPADSAPSRRGEEFLALFQRLPGA